MYNLFKLHSVLGKIVFLALIMIASHYHMLFGVLAVLLYMLLTQYTIEGMNNMEINEDNKDNKDSKDGEDKEDNKDGKDNSAKDAIAKFKIDNCKDGKLMKDNKEITPELIKESFPDIKFDGESCNPCDEDCKFQIVSSAEQLTNEENLRSQDSNATPVDRNIAIKKIE